MADSTNATLVLTNVQTSHDADYRVVVTNIQGSAISEFAHLTVIRPPVIVQQPTNWLVLSIGASVTNRVQASGTTPLAYQWCLNGAPLPGQTKNSIILTNVQLSNAGDYTAVVTNIGGSVTSRVVTLTVDSTFVKITTGAIVTDVDYHAAAAWSDYDGDGFLDLFVPNGGYYSSASRKNSLYHNNRDGTFTKITTNALSAAFGSWKCGVWADVDNDGDLDLYVGGRPGSGTQAVFYRNDGGGRFTAVSIVPTVDAASRDSISVSWGDYDQDGWVDLFVPTFTHPSNHHLFRNLGDLNFKAMTDAVVGDLVAPAAHESSPMAIWIDYDNDGDLDIYVWQNVFALYLNSGSGFFTRTFTGSIANAPDRASVPSWADYDNDGYMDLFVTLAIDGINALHHNLGGTNSVEVTQAAGLDRPMTSIMGSWGDYDNDGNLDLFVVNTPNWLYPPTVLRTANMLYRSNGDGTFTEVDVGSPIWEPRDDWDPHWIDYDNDGFLDLFIGAGEYSPEVNYLYRNNLRATGNTNRWLKVSLVGKASNASGIGTKVRATANIRGQTVTQLRAIEAPSGSGGSLIAHFGLGDATNVTTLRIEWPSGIVQVLTNVAANQSLKVVECQGYAGLCPSFAGATRQANGLQISITEPAADARYVLEGSTDLLNWTKLMAKTSVGGTAQYTDTRAANYTNRFYRVVVP